MRQPEPLLQRLAQVPGLYLVGGYMRQLYWGQPCRDIDLCTDQPFAEIVALIARLLAVHPIELNQRFQSIRFMVDGTCIDLTPLHPGGLAADLQRRDYTINTLALPLKQIGPAFAEAALQMHPQALADLEQRHLRMVSRENLRDDPLRILRGYRLAACEELQPTVETRLAWSEFAAETVKVAAERIHEELLLWFGARSIVATVRWCAEDGVLWQLFPALQQSVDCAQNDYHHLDVWRHTLEALQQLELLYADLPKALQNWSSEIREATAREIAGCTPGLPLLRIALLLHDVGKPQTKAVEADGHISFLEHQRVGQGLALAALERLKFSNDETELISLLILEHLRLGFYSEHDPLPARLIYRFIRQLNAAVPLMLLHSLADCAATRGPRNLGKFEEHLHAAAQILLHYYKQDAIATPPLLLDGHDIMELLQLKPGPEVGRLKTSMLEATAAGEISTVEEARRFVLEQHAINQQPR